MKRSAPYAPLLCTALIACGGASTGDVPEQVDAAVVASQEALQAAALTAEASKQVVGDSFRADNPCPAITKEGSITNFTVTADYGDGCVPDSGLIADEVSGSVGVTAQEQSLTVDLGQLTTSGTTVDGSVKGAYAFAGVNALVLSMDADLSMTGTNNGHYVQDIDLTLTLTDAQLMGTSVAAGDVYEATVIFEMVVLDYASAAQGACILPSSGTAYVDLDGLAASIAFDADTPATGTADVTVDGITYEDVPVC